MNGLGGQIFNRCWKLEGWQASSIHVISSDAILSRKSRASREATQAQSHRYRPEAAIDDLRTEVRNIHLEYLCCANKS
jgi:hypothetical protein